MAGAIRVMNSVTPGLHCVCTIVDGGVYGGCVWVACTGGGCCGVVCVVCGWWGVGLDGLGCTHLLRLADTGIRRP